MWHFTNLDCKLRFDDGRKVVAGETLTVDRDPILCKRGLHASERIIDALSNAPGLYVWSVALGGKRIDGDDKSAAQSRTALWGYDATDVILAWSRRVALDAIDLYWDASKFGKMPDVVMEFLRTGDKKIAEAAAYAAAEAAARAAAEAKYNQWLEDAILAGRPIV